MSSGGLDYNLTSTRIEITGTTSSPEDLASFIIKLRDVLEVFEKTAAIRQRLAAQGIETREGDDPVEGRRAEHESPVPVGDAPKEHRHDRP